MKHFALEWDKNYGINQRTGWSVIVNGSVCSPLEKWLVVAIAKAIYTYWFVWDKECRREDSYE